jgi:hypothetical protein
VQAFVGYSLHNAAHIGASAPTRLYPARNKARPEANLAPLTRARR